MAAATTIRGWGWGRGATQRHAPHVFESPLTFSSTTTTTTTQQEQGQGQPELSSSISSSWEGPTQLLPFGSYRLDVHDPSSDLDLLLVAPRGVGRAAFFASFAQRHLKGHPAVSFSSFFEGLLIVWGWVGGVYYYI